MTLLVLAVLAAIAIATGSWLWFTVVVCIPLLFARYYVTIVAGKERRKPDRLEGERRRHPLETAGNVVFALVVGVILGLATLMAIRLAILAVLGHTGGPVTFA